MAAVTPFVPDYHTRLIELLGVRDLVIKTRCFASEATVLGAQQALLATAAACVASRALSTPSCSDEDGGYASNSVSDLARRLHPQLCLVIVEMLALAPEPNMLCAGLRALHLAISTAFDTGRRSGQPRPPMCDQDCAALSCLFRPLVQLVAPALLHAAGSSVLQSLMADAHSSYISMLCLVMSARPGESESTGVHGGYCLMQPGSRQAVDCLLQGTQPVPGRDPGAHAHIVPS